MAPQHVAIILDGNRRWATQRGLPKLLGHTEGAKALEPVLEEAQRLGVRFMTLYCLSTENVKGRSQEELDHLFKLFVRLVDYEKRFREKNARVRMLGDLSLLPETVRSSLRSLEAVTAANTGLEIAFAIGYGGRDELVRAARKMAGQNPEHITQELFASALDTAGMPSVDLVIRTGGHHRLSNFLLWQAAYAELYFTDTFWPDFTPERLREAIEWYETQQRNGGK